MAYNNSERPASRRPARRRRKVCVFCGGEEISYKDAAKLKKYVSERGKILPRRVTGTCAKHQRAVTVAVKRARHMAIMPYVDIHHKHQDGQNQRPSKIAPQLAAQLHFAFHFLTPFQRCVLYFAPVLPIIPL